jgi:hypothetical protein
MAATVVDALVVSLGLNAKDFLSGAKKVTVALKDTSDEATKRAKEMEASGKIAAQYFSKIRNEALALLGVFTAGVGIKNFVENTIVGAASLGRLSQNLGISTERLSAWQRVAEDAGGTAEGMTAQLKESQKTIAQFKMGQSSESLQWFFRMGGKTSDLKDGNTYLMARSKIISEIFKTDPGRAQLVASQMGISEDQFNLLKQGPAAVQAQVAAMEKLSAITAEDARQADELRKKWLGVERTFTLVGIKVVEALMPAFDTLIGYIKQLGDWVVSHKDDITNWVNGAVKSIQDFAKMANDAAESVGGWKNVLIGLAAIKVLGMVSPLLSLAGALTSVGSALGVIGGGVGATALAVLGGIGAMVYSKGLNTGEDDYLKAHQAAPGATWDGDPVGRARQGAKSGSLADRQNYLAGRLKGAGYTDAQVAGIIGSLMQESGLDPTAVNKTSGATGIAQWLGPRAKAFQKQFGHSLKESTFGEQTDFMLQELKTTEKLADKRIRTARTAAQAAEIHAREFERPGAAEANIARRQGYANSVYASLGQANAAAVASLPVGSSVAAPPIASTSNTSSSEVNINGPINVHTQATDAAGVARGLGSEISKYHFVAQANTGLT